MDKEQIVLDFSVFVLFEVEELLSYVTNFFGQLENNDPFDFKTLNYEEYIRQDIFTKQILENNNFENEIKSINDLLNSSELNNLRDFLNNNFEEGFPDGDRHGTYSNASSLEIKNSDLVIYFNDYLKYRNFNKNVFITYYIQVFSSLNKSVSDTLKLEVAKVQNINKTKDLLDLKLSSDYVGTELEKYKLKLFKSIKKNNFQFKGSADEKGLYFDERKTLIEYLEYLNKNENIDYEYPCRLPQIDDSLHYLVFRYYLYALNGIQLDLNVSEIFNPKVKLSEYKLVNKNLINFLGIKGFDDIEIDILINTLNGGVFNILEIRYLPINRQVEIFHIFYCFYIFDYFIEVEKMQFNTEKEFEKIMKLQSIKESDKNSQNQFYKYYNEISSNRDNRQYPFKKIDETIDKIVNLLNIEKGKLKSIPKPKK